MATVNGKHNGAGAGYPSNEQLYQDLLLQLGLEPLNQAEIIGADPVTHSVHRIGDATAAALAALGSEMATIWKMRTGKDETVTVSVEQAIPQLMAVYLTSLNGVGLARLLEDPNLLGYSDFYRARGGRYVYLLCTYPHLRDINCEVLNCAFSRTKLADAVARWDAFELEERICSLGGTCIAIRTREEWRESPQGLTLKNTQVIDIEKLNESPPEPFPALDGDQQGLPLSGIRVLDNTHVIAGPMASRITGEYGAEVLSMVSPDHMDPRAMNQSDRAQFWEVLRDADVYVTNYLSLEKKGFGPQSLIRHRPGLVYVDFHGWGKDGPWLQRGGFDQLACSASGFSIEEGSSDGPSLPPTHLLNDYLAAILGATGIAEALRRRATVGGSYRVHINLSRVAMWVQDMGLFNHAEVASLPIPKSARFLDRVKLREVDGKFGRTRYLPTQINYRSGEIRPTFSMGADPTGASPFQWRDST